MTTNRASSNALGDFLRSRRARVDADALGVVSYRHRRVPGLRREELAERAGVSVAYLTRLEQGGAGNVSEQVLHALATALLLSDAERVHLLELAHPSTDRAVTHLPHDVVSAGVRQLLDAMTVPALVFSRAQDVLAWNALGHALIGPHLDRHARPNMVRLLFGDPATRAMFLDWEQEAELAVGSLRFVAARFPDDEQLRSLVGELCMRDDDFAALWARHPVALCTGGAKRLHHPWVGRIEVQYEVLHLPEEHGQRMITYTAGSGTADGDALTLIARRALLGSPSSALDA